MLQTLSSHLFGREKEGVKHYKLEIRLRNTTSVYLMDTKTDMETRKEAKEAQREEKTRRKELQSELLPQGKAAINRLNSSIFQF